MRNMKSRAEKRKQEEQRREENEEERGAERGGRGSGGGGVQHFMVLLYFNKRSTFFSHTLPLPRNNFPPFSYQFSPVFPYCPYNVHFCCVPGLRGGAGLRSVRCGAKQGVMRGETGGRGGVG